MGMMLISRVQFILYKLVYVLWRENGRGRYAVANGSAASKTDQKICLLSLKFWKINYLKIVFPKTLVLEPS